MHSFQARRELPEVYILQLPGLASFSWQVVAHVLASSARNKSDEVTWGVSGLQNHGIPILLNSIN